MTDFMTAKDVELAIVDWLDVRQYLIVPNVSWGLGVHECDLLALSKSGYATEFEIKVTKADLIRDSKKEHGHRSGKIKHLYFAIPEEIESCADLIPANAGIVVIEYWSYRFHCRILREAPANGNARPFTDEERFKLARLGTMRMWNLKRTLWQNHHHQEAEYQI